jgi:quinoprotein dehydrogenase-associated probable ABC transporter substrate-binding protein
MCSRSLSAALVVASVSVVFARGAERVLRVCADPNNLPFSNAREEGFENRIARLAAGAIGARLEYTWYAQRRGFIRNTLGAGTCDAIVGIPHGLEAVDTTRPYYRSTHVFVTRARDGLTVRSMDDPRLARLRIGVHVVGDDYASLPPLQALGRRGLVHNVSGYSLYGNYGEPDPPARLVEAVAKGDVDVAIVWGPLGGYFAARQTVALQVTQMADDRDGRGVPFTYDISMGVRKGDRHLRETLQDVLDARHADIESILRTYRMPLKPLAASKGGA